MRKTLNEINIPSLKDETMKQMASTGVLAKGSDGVLSALDTVRDMKENDEMEEKWSEEYKNSIDCSNPKGFSQKAHCQGKKKNTKEEIDEVERTYLSKLKELARKYAYDDSTDSTTKDKIEKMFLQLKKQYRKGIEVEKEHKSADPRKIALDHLGEDPKYYDKLEKIESKEATGSGSAGGYEMPLFGKIETNEDDDITKVEATEATGSGSAGSYETPAAWAKTMKKKDWRGASKTQLPGGKFVQVKKKCKKFPYCNQGDIKALNIFENEILKKVIKRVSEKNNISEQVIKNIIAYELSNKSK
jgi:hypothetical protein